MSVRYGRHTHRHRNTQKHTNTHTHTHTHGHVVIKRTDYLAKIHRSNARFIPLEPQWDETNYSLFFILQTTAAAFSPKGALPAIPLPPL
jgi:hypothetical protein